MPHLLSDSEQQTDFLYARICKIRIKRREISFTTFPVLKDGWCLFCNLFHYLPHFMNEAVSKYIVKSRTCIYIIAVTFYVIVHTDFMLSVMSHMKVINASRCIHKYENLKRKYTIAMQLFILTDNVCLTWKLIFTEQLCSLLLCPFCIWSFSTFSFENPHLKKYWPTAFCVLFLLLLMELCHIHCHKKINKLPQVLAISSN